jgi:two-component sensor histidine kinase
MEEDIFWRKDGTSFPVSYASTPIIENGIIVGAVVTFQNISDRKQVQEKMNSSLREKELLLKEIHHRVKNNMQILNSLISFQIKENNDSRINQILAECKNRIRTMSIIHEKLYQSKYFSSIDIRNLISDIAGALVYSLRDMGKQIDLIVNIPDISVGIDTAIPLGLIVNEIVSNSLKHAFPSDMNGEIAINLHAVNEGFELSIRDTGIGFPDAFNMEKTDSLGMFLIYTLVEQLGGNIKIVSDNGTTITINFNRH